MKKIILTLVTVFVGLVSCTNSDIMLEHTISYNVDFKINPATVIAPFTYENNPGELESFDTDYKLRIRLLIYNTEGLLVEEETQYFTNYATVLSTNKVLPKGHYTAITISDITKKDESTEFWTLTDYTSLSNATIKASGNIGTYGKDILGVAQKTFTIEENLTSDININIQPAGCLFLTYYHYIHEFNNVESYELAVSKIYSDCKFDKQGYFTTSWLNNNGSFDWRINIMETDGNESNNYYHYTFMLPTSNLKLKFRAWTMDQEYIDITPEMAITTKAGEEYMLSINFRENLYTSPTIVNNKRSNLGPQSDKLPISETSVLYLKNIGN